jgi:hypothetical protein
MVPERTRGVLGELVGGLSLSLEINTMSASGPGRTRAVEGQMRKLAGVLGQIIAKKYGTEGEPKKYGTEGEQLSGLNEEDNQQVRGSNFVNEA